MVFCRRLSSVVGFLVIFLLSRESLGSVSYSQRLLLRDETLEMQRHAWSAYWKYAYPADELKPLSCAGRRWDKRSRGTLDDSLGGYLLTLVDGADALALSGDYESYAAAVDAVLDNLHFDRDIAVSTFEATIRVLGGLLSLHTIATDPRLDRRGVNAYFLKGDARAARLLALAVDLGERLLVAFDTPTGIPLHRVNLRRGALLSAIESRETCAAAGGTYLLELGRLSRLTGDPRFERAARKAVFALWERRSPRDLVGSTIDVRTGQWTQRNAGVGAGSDSFYEYLLKSAIYFDDAHMRHISNTAIAAVAKETTFLHDQQENGGLRWNAEVDHVTGKITSLRVSALAAFWPSLLVLNGQLQAAQLAFASYWSLWRKYKALPDLFDLPSAKPVHFARDSPLRPELAESALHLFLATQDEHYLVVAREQIFALQNISRVDCGFAAIADVESHRLDDRMDSYFFAETMKYLFLIFDLTLEPHHRKSFFCATQLQCQQYHHQGSKKNSSSNVYQGDNNPNGECIDSPLSSSSSSSSTRQRKKQVKKNKKTTPINAEDDSLLPAACDPTRCMPMSEIIFSTEGHLFDMRHRNLENTNFGPFVGLQQHNIPAGST